MRVYSGVKHDRKSNFLEDDITAMLEEIKTSQQV